MGEMMLLVTDVGRVERESGSDYEVAVSPAIKFFIHKNKLLPKLNAGDQLEVVFTCEYDKGALKDSMLFGARILQGYGLAEDLARGSVYCNPRYETFLPQENHVLDALDSLLYRADPRPNRNTGYFPILDYAVPEGGMPLAMREGVVKISARCKPTELHVSAYIGDGRRLGVSSIKVDALKGFKKGEVVNFETNDPEKIAALKKDLEQIITR